MKKTLLIILILCLLIPCACTPDIVKSGGKVIHGNPLPTVDTESCYDDEDIVYITASGSKYHTEDCSFLKSSKIPVSLEQAIAQGLTPCARCFPES